MRKKLVIANWKMYKTVSETAGYIQQFKNMLNSADLAETNPVLCVPFTSIAMASSMLRGSGAAIGAQNMHHQTEGPFTGEISASMLKDAGAGYVLFERHMFGESFKNVNLKVLRALESGLSPIISVGETAQERDDFRTEEVLRNQTMSALRDIPEHHVKNIIIAYVPVWAIGTGNYASVAEASGAVMDLRGTVREMYGGLASEEIHMIYGGSVTAVNARNLLATPNIDGVIIGRGSLNASDFHNIIKCARD